MKEKQKLNERIDENLQFRIAYSSKFICYLLNRKKRKKEIVGIVDERERERKRGEKGKIRGKLRRNEIS